MTHEQLIQKLLAESKEDFLQMSEIISHAILDTGRIEDFDEWDFGPGVPEHPHLIRDPAERKVKTLTLIRDLLNTRQIRVRSYREKSCLEGGEVKYAPRISVGTVIDHIDREWSRLGREPDPTDDLLWLERCESKDWPHEE